ncbi:type VI secretion system-associated protein TagF [Variovorax boronicumulans]|uniref:Type VI secretion system-associated protein TagF n=1 Tax=Variovorax boronicumulans TaxID=436515 RepID=A0A250DEA0_9BURK|nr:type VI secretion system-associated protein TagF [Variovorax boronicumulans]ATA52299.1 type VI secretion system-associated protein TagF [Variovorax boronicumulans]
MSLASSSLFVSSELPGWFGKLPGMGDFAHRRLPEAFRSVWDPWLQRGLARLRDRHADWTAHYLEAPVWCFALGAQVVGERGWMGVLMPSVDGVGRYFPFTLAVELDEGVPGALRGEALVAALRWWALGTQAVLEGLEGDLDALRFDAALSRLFVGVAAEPSADDRSLELPLAGASLWMETPGLEGGVRMLATGLPRDVQFEALFLGGGE